MQQHHHNFIAAVELLGGPVRAARAIGFTPVYISALVAGNRQLTDNVMDKTAAALLAHHRVARGLERVMTPLFSANRIAPATHSESA